MRKLSLVIALAILVTTPCFAAATKADRSRFGSNATPNITDSSNGNTADVSNAGDLIVRPRGKSIFFVNGATTAAPGTGNAASEIGLGAQATTVYSITYTGDTAGDTLLIYDATSAAVGTNVKFEIEVGTAKQTVHISIPSGASFATEVYLKFLNVGGGTQDSVTITYDTDTIS